MSFSYLDLCDNVRTVDITETVVFSFEIPSTTMYIALLKWLQDRKTEYYFVDDWVSGQRRCFRIYIPDSKMRTMCLINFS